MRNCRLSDVEPNLPTRQAFLHRCPSRFCRFGLAWKAVAISSATAALMGFTALLAMLLQRPLLPGWKNVGAFVTVLIMAAPYFAVNAAAIYHYIHLGLVEQYGIFDDQRPFWTDALYYSAGPINRLTLSTAFFMGILLVVWNCKLFSMFMDGATTQSAISASYP